METANRMSRAQFGKKSLTNTDLLISIVGMVLDHAKKQILDAAQRQVQLRGHNGYSYRDLSRELDITTAGIHYHFPSKDDLGRALIERYGKNVTTYLAEIAATSPDLKTRMRKVAGIFESIIGDNGKVCICAALGSEYHALPEVMKKELGRLISEIEGWIHRFLAEGKARGELPEAIDAKSLATLWHSALQGALVMSRATDGKRLQNTIQELMRTIQG